VVDDQSDITLRSSGGNLLVGGIGYILFQTRADEIGAVQTYG